MEESEKEKKLTEHLGDFECFGWKVKVVMINHEHIILKGQRGRQAITKKYVYEKVKAKVETGLEAWVSSKL